MAALTPGDLDIGMQVVVIPRTWPGINKPGGHGTINKIHYDENGVAIKVDVKYSTMCGNDKLIDLAYVKRSEFLVNSRRTRSLSKVAAEKPASENADGAEEKKTKGTASSAEGKENEVTSTNQEKNASTTKKKNKKKNSGKRKRTALATIEANNNEVKRAKKSSLFDGIADGEWVLIEDGKMTDYIDCLQKGQRVSFWWDDDQGWLLGTVTKGLMKRVTKTMIKWVVSVRFDGADCTDSLKFHPRDKRWKVLNSSTIGAEGASKKSSSSDVASKPAVTKKVKKVTPKKDNSGAIGAEVKSKKSFSSDAASKPAVSKKVKKVTPKKDNSGTVGAEGTSKNDAASKAAVSKKVTPKKDSSGESGLNRSDSDENKENSKVTAKQTLITSSLASPASHENTSQKISVRSAEQLPVASLPTKPLKDDERRDLPVSSEKMPSESAKRSTHSAKKEETTESKNIPPVITPDEFIPSSPQETAAVGSSLSISKQIVGKSIETNVFPPACHTTPKASRKSKELSLKDAEKPSYAKVCAESLKPSGDEGKEEKVSIQSLYKAELEKSEKFVQSMVTSSNAQGKSDKLKNDCSSPGSSNSDNEEMLEVKFDDNRMQEFNSMLFELIKKGDLDSMPVDDMMDKINRIWAISTSNVDNSPFTVLEVKAFLSKLHNDTRIYMDWEDGKLGVIYNI